MHKLFPCLQVAQLHLIWDVVSSHSVALLKKVSLLINIFFVSVPSTSVTLVSHLRTSAKWFLRKTRTDHFFSSFFEAIISRSWLIILLSQTNRDNQLVIERKQKVISAYYNVYQQSGQQCQAWHQWTESPHESENALFWNSETLVQCWSVCPAPLLWVIQCCLLMINCLIIS